MKQIRFSAFLFVLIPFIYGCSASSADLSPAALGPKDAPVLVEEFSDLQCPACGLVSPQAERVARQENVRFVFYHFPLPYHTQAFLAAEAAECARDQGHFWEFTELAFQNQNNLQESALKAMAKSLSLNEDQFASCLSGGAKKTIVRSHMAEGRRRQIPGTPSFFVNGKLIPWTTPEAFAAFIRNPSF